MTLTAPATTCAAVSTVRPATRQPDPHRYRGVLALAPVGDNLHHPRGQRHCRHGYPGSTSEAEATLTGCPSRSTGPPNTTVTFCSDPRSRLTAAAQLQTHYRHREPRLAIS